MDFKLEHPEEAYSLMEVTDDGILMNDRLVQLKNAYDPIDVIFPGISTVFKLLHS